MTINQRFQHWVKDFFRPILEERGYARAGLRYHRDVRESIVLIDIQKSRKSSAERVIFTVTLGVHNIRIGQFFGAETKRPAPEECHYTIRLGELLTPPSDLWWTFAGDGDEGLEAEMRQHMLNAVAHIEGLSSSEELMTVWKNGAGPGLTLLQRLMYLSVLQLNAKKRPELEQTVQRMREISASKPSAAAVAEHVRMLVAADVQ